MVKKLFFYGFDNKLKFKIKFEQKSDLQRYKNIYYINIL